MRGHLLPFSGQAIVSGSTESTGTTILKDISAQCFRTARKWELSSSLRANSGSFFPMS